MMNMRRGQDADGDAVPVFADDRAPRYRERIRWIAAEIVSGEDPRSDAFAARYEENLRRLAAHLVD